MTRTFTLLFAAAIALASPAHGQTGEVSVPQTRIGAAAVLLSSMGLFPSGIRFAQIDEKTMRVIEPSSGENHFGLWASKVVEVTPCRYEFYKRESDSRAVLQVNIDQIGSQYFYDKDGLVVLGLGNAIPAYCRRGASGGDGVCFKDLRVTRHADIARVLRALEFLRASCPVQERF